MHLTNGLTSCWHAAVTCRSMGGQRYCWHGPMIQERAHIRVQIEKAHGTEQGAESTDPCKGIIAHSWAAHSDHPDISGRPLQRCPHTTQRRLCAMLLRIRSHACSHGWDMHVICRAVPGKMQGSEEAASILGPKGCKLQRKACKLHARTHQASAQAVARAIHPCGWCAPAHAIYHTPAVTRLSFSIQMVCPLLQHNQHTDEDVQCKA